MDLPIDPYHFNITYHCEFLTVSYCYISRFNIVYQGAVDIVYHLNDLLAMEFFLKKPNRKIVCMYDL